MRKSCAMYSSTEIMSLTIILAEANAQTERGKEIKMATETANKNTILFKEVPRIISVDNEIEFTFDNGMLTIQIDNPWALRDDDDRSGQSASIDLTAEQVKELRKFLQKGG